jgi:hypothetical protein
MHLATKESLYFFKSTPNEGFLSAHFTELPISKNFVAFLAPLKPNAL